MKKKRIKLNNDVFNLILFLILNGLLGYLSIELLCEIFSWNVPLWFHMCFGYIFGFILAPITLIVLTIKILFGV